MLATLAIRDIVLVDRLEIQAAPGLTVLTGETGAGKSILLDALALALGSRGDAALVRAGAAQGQVTAAFEVPPDHPAWQILADSGIAADEDGGDGALILRRIQLADGRTRAFVNDQPVGAQVLRALGRALVEIHGQHDERALVDPAVHRALLDAFGGLDVAQVSVRWQAWRGAAERLDAERAAAARARADIDFLRHAADELALLAPELGEEERLAERRQAMINAEKVAGDLGEAHAAIAGSSSPVPGLAAAIRRLERRAAQVPELVAPAVAALDAALNALAEGRDHLERALRTAAFDPRELERAEERLFALRAAGRKFNVAVDALPALAERFAADLAAIDAGEGRLAALAAEAEAAEAAYRAAAARLSAARVKAARALERAIAAELPDLKLERARFLVPVESDPAAPGPDGIDRVRFEVQTNPGTRPGPLMKIASGGELARFLLALKVALADRGSAPTLVFDEVDTGVGGAVADAIGARLARLGAKVQVLAVTHAPQVAARAANHLLIVKEGIGGEERVATRVSPLGKAARREEIARMLAGAEITAEARAAARRLLQGAA
ncbi:MAG TPA: DNA repair protein RecN [Hyphomicrobiales bacterium]|nr:DNA repair protein RecN [Hyphomicrobiales bacterium]